MPCVGNSTDVCGGPNRLTVFGNGGPLPPGLSTNPGPAGWTSAGCFTDNDNARALTGPMVVPGGGGVLTVAVCTSRCSGYQLAGVEYGGECCK